MVEHPDLGDLGPATYLRVMRMVMDEALEEGLTLDQAKQQAQKIVQPAAGQIAPEEKPLKNAA